MECPHCQSEKVVKNGKDSHQDGKAIQNYLCEGCGKRFNERTGPAMESRCPSRRRCHHRRRRWVYIIVYVGVAIITGLYFSPALADHGSKRN
jgi:transposase-like protein